MNSCTSAKVIELEGVKNRYVVSRQFNTSGYYTFIHFFFWIFAIINLAAFLGRAPNLGAVQGGSLLVMMYALPHYVTFTFVKLNNFIIDREVGVVASTQNVFFRKNEINFTFEDIEEMKVIETLISKKLEISLVNGKTFKFTFDSWHFGGRYSASKIESDFSFENEEFIEVARSLGERHEDSMTKVIFKIIECFRK